MNRKQYGDGQVVTEGELDSSFADCEDAERGLALDAGMCQVAVGSSPGPDIYGGINEGLVVAKSGTDDFVDVTAGSARDTSNRRCHVPTDATVKITNLGATAEGATVDAVGSGSQIIDSCPIGQRIIVSLFLVYDEHQSDMRYDEAEDPYYFEEEESFHFYLTEGVAFTHAPGSTPGRAALVDNMVLLTDLLLTNSAGAMQCVAVCNTSAEWDALTGYYANLAGRRSDQLAIDSTAAAPLVAAAGTSIRGRTGREALLSAIQALGATTTPTGSELIGARAWPETELRQGLPVVLSLSADTIDAQLLSILQELNRRVVRGPDFPRPFFDDFLYSMTGAAGLWDPDLAEAPNPMWRSIVDTGGHEGDLHLINSSEGYPAAHGILQIRSKDLANTWYGIQQGYLDSSTENDPYLLVEDKTILRVRFSVPSFTDVVHRIGFRTRESSSAVNILIDSTAAVKLEMVNSAGSQTVLSASLGSMTTNVWYEATVGIIDANNAQIIIGENTEAVELTVGALSNIGHAFYAYAGSKVAGGGTQTSLSIDWVGVSGTVDRVVGTLT
jgi:hypothetical protein